MTRRILPSLVVLLGSTALFGCDDGEPENPDAHAGMTSTSLQQAQSCDDLLGKLKADALEQMHTRFDAMIDSLLRPQSYWGGDDVANSDGATGGGDLGAPSAGGEEGGGTQGPPIDYSETNVQVEGVDEADIVKTDGNYIYLLHGQSFSIVNAWPSSELGMSASYAIEGFPLEMFVADGRAIVFSQVDGTPVFEEAGKELPGGGGGYDPYYGGGDFAEPGYGGYYGPTMTKVTVLELADGATPTAVAEHYFEGSYTSSRRIDGTVRAVLTGGVHLPDVRYYPEYDGDSFPTTSAGMILALEQLRVANIKAIENATLEDFLPHDFARSDEGVSEIAPDCTSHLLPEKGTTEYGMTKIVAFDIDAPETPSRTSIHGATHTVYSNQETMVLAARAWDYGDWGMAMPSVPTTVNWTHVHAFDVSGDRLRPQYLASATVPGELNDQFSIDATQNQVRLTTTETISSTEMWEQVNGLYVLRLEGNQLSRQGEVRGLAPTESIYSTRFIGDLAYVVTFRQVDPLFVIDLANPAEPTVLAELKIPGFSEYMHPMEGGTHLLTVGREATDEGVVEGVALQIFDVSDPTNPILAHKHVMDDEWGYTEASVNHKAFTFYNNWLAIPYESYGNGDDWGSSLRLFEIDAESGIQPVATIDHTSFFGEDPWSYCYATGVRRGLFIEDNVYSISYGGVMVHDMADLAEPLASLPLASPSDSCDYYYY